MPRSKALTIATVSRSLALQSPEAWQLLDERSYDITFAAARDTWTDVLLERNPGSTFLEIRAERSLRVGTLLDLARRLRALSRDEWDLVQVQSPIIAALWRLVGTRRARGHTVYVVHGFHFQPGERSLRSHAVRLIEGALAHRTLALATVSEADARFVRSLPRPLRPSVLSALPGAGVPVENCRDPGPAPADAPAGPYALFVGDLNVNKDPLCAVDAVAECHRRGRMLDLVVIGEGPLVDAIETAAQQHPWLHHIPRTDQMPRWMSHAEVLIAPSHREGLPRVVIEALAAGTPVVARHNRGSAQLLADGLGRIVTTGDPSAWAEAVGNALDSPTDRDQLWARAQVYGVSGFRSAYRDLVSQMERHRRRASPRRSRLQERRRLLPGLGPLPDTSPLPGEAHQRRSRHFRRNGPSGAVGQTDTVRTNASSGEVTAAARPPRIEFSATALVSLGSRLAWSISSPT